LSARQVAGLLHGKQFIAFATASHDGAPRVMPLDALFVHGRWHWTTDAAAARIAHLRRDPRCSATWFQDDDLMVTAHGRAELIDAGHPDYEELESIWEREAGSRPSSWGTHVYHGRIEPTHLYAYAQHPENFLDS
jgi:general stress protein 26